MKDEDLLYVDDAFKNSVFLARRFMIKIYCVLMMLQELGSEPVDL
jgi:hypothetical protein